MFSLKFVNFSGLKLLSWSNFIKQQFSFPILRQFLGYAIFGLGNVCFFAMAFKKIPASPAFAIWTAHSIILMKLTEMIFFKEKIVFTKLFFILLITAGIVGLKVFSES